MGYLWRAAWSGFVFVVLLLVGTMSSQPLLDPAYAPLIVAAILFAHEVTVFKMVDLNNKEQVRNLIALTIAVPIMGLMHPNIGGYIGKQAFSLLKIGGGYPATLGLTQEGCSAIPTHLKVNPFDCSSVPVRIWLKDASYMYLSLAKGDSRHWSIQREKIVVEAPGSLPIRP